MLASGQAVQEGGVPYPVVIPVLVAQPHGLDGLMLPAGIARLVAACTTLLMLLMS